MSDEQQTPQIRDIQPEGDWTMVDHDQVQDLTNAVLDFLLNATQKILMLRPLDPCC